MTVLVDQRVAWHPQFARTVESILAHFEVTQASCRHRSRNVHAPPLAAQAVARSWCIRGLSRSANAPRGAGARSLARCGVAPGATPRFAMARGAGPHPLIALQAASGPRLDGAGPGCEPLLVA